MPGLVEDVELRGLPPCSFLLGRSETEFVSSATGFPVEKPRELGTALRSNATSDSNWRSHNTNCS